MGSFSLSVLVGLCIFLPGAAFVLGLTRLYNPSAPSSPIDQHFSAGLALAVAANVVIHGVGFSLATGYTRARGLPEPDVGPVLALLSGDLKSAWGKAGVQSLAEFPLRISAYFLTNTAIAWGAGILANRLIRLRPRASWSELLRPQEVSFVWLTTEVQLDGTCYLFAGPVQEFSVGKDGNLERVVLPYAIKKPLPPLKRKSADGVPPEQPPQGAASGAELNDGWTEIPGEILVLQLKDSKTVNLDYFYEKEEAPKVAKSPD
ncbi:hypothetical protein ACVKU6_001726 [Stenotrophomonas sp. PvP086]